MDYKSREEDFNDKQLLSDSGRVDVAYLQSLFNQRLLQPCNCLECIRLKYVWRVAYGCEYPRRSR